MLKALYWNCRGIANAPTSRSLLFLVKSHSLDIIFFSEPKTSSSQSLSMKLESLGFFSFFSNTSQASAPPSIWCFTRSPSNASCSIVDHSPQHLTVSLNSPLNEPFAFITGIYASTSFIQRRLLW